MAGPHRHPLLEATARAAATFFTLIPIHIWVNFNLFYMKRYGRCEREARLVPSLTKDVLNTKSTCEAEQRRINQQDRGWGGGCNVVSAR